MCPEFWVHIISSKSRFLSHSHHMMVFYDVKIESNQLEEIQIVLDDEINDSNGICWLEINKINIDNTSPLLLK